MIGRRFAWVAALGAAMLLTARGAGEQSFLFREVKYLHRWSQGTQHEFTPEKQEDLDHFTDMITVNTYPGVDDNEKMAGAANAVLGRYRSSRGKILKTRSVPGTKERPTEHFISVMFDRPEFVEIAFAHFKLVDKEGHSFVYSHRFYGDDKSEKASAWLKAEGDAVEKALMEWDAHP